MPSDPTTFLHMMIVVMNVMVMVPRSLAPIITRLDPDGSLSLRGARGKANRRRLADPAGAAVWTAAGKARLGLQGPAGERPEPPHRQMNLLRAPQSLATSAAFSNCATLPRICLIMTAVCVSSAEIVAKRLVEHLERSGFFVVNVGSENPRLAIKLPRAYMVIVDHVSIENAINEAKRRIDEAISAYF
jgi:hypothetical protein